MNSIIKTKELFARNKEWLKNGLLIITVLIVIGIIKNQISPREVELTIEAIRKETGSSLLIMALLGLGTVAVSTIYDFLICREMRLKLPKKNIFKAAWIANTSNNVLSVGGVAGGSVRTALYKRFGLKIADSVNVSIIVWVSGLTGLAGLIWLNAYYIYGLENPGYKFLAFFISLYIPLFFLMNKLRFLPKKICDNPVMNLNLKIKLKLLTVSTLVWISNSFFFYSLIVHFSPGMNYPIILAAFTLATIIGMCSPMPGGIGAFDLVFVYALKSFASFSPAVFPAILLYRMFYSFLPWATSIVLELAELFLRRKAI